MDNYQRLYSVTLVDAMTNITRRVFGYHVGTNLAGEYLMQIKPDDSIVAVDKSCIEEILPFTFEVRMNGKSHHFQGKEGSVSVGDILLWTGNGIDEAKLAVVKRLDTKQRYAKEFRGKRILVSDL